MKKTMRNAVLSSALVTSVLFSGAMDPSVIGGGFAKAERVPEIQISNGMTQPVFSLSEAIVERVFVETEVDSDRDGKLDRVRADIIRPKETENGLKVPVIYEMSPYRSGILNVPVYDVDHELYAVPSKEKSKQATYPMAEPNLSGYYDDYFVPRGYAVILAESIGTGLSTGCPTTGDQDEVLGTKAVIDWVNGRTKAFDAEGKEISADWSTGDVGMTGVSYNGTLPNAVAGTGVEGLKTIVPVAAISSWYEYYRSNGLVVAPGGYQGEDADNMAEAVLTRANPEACEEVIQDLTEGMDRTTGDYNDFWKERDYTKDAKNIDASVFVVHGLNDWNVKTKHFSDWWEVLKKNDVPRKLWLHQGGHSSPYSFRKDEWLSTLNKWFDYWLYDIDNDVMDQPSVDIQREDKTWTTEESWPAAGAKKTNLYLNPSSEEADGTLTLKPVLNKYKIAQSFTDEPMIKAEDLALNPETASPHRLVYVTAPFDKKVRLSGTPEVSIRASINKPVSNLTALLVRYGADKTEIITRGWADPQNLHDETRSTALKPGKYYTFSWDLQPDDYVFNKGDKLGIVLMASDYNYTIRPKAGTKIEIDPRHSRIELPIVGGAKVLNWK
ncbi:Xaa-Pro dipeptidyl-peptidase [Jeotgalibacillus sp. S-D1]|uniref:Xaa-Pro dipeptidyl-peptidase n=1 Tax=Jeotgalibacillus sp. S-D1 TaxID=2552189 RepID=UPI00105A973D|nr:Xaa-Pro dipeptidyl-peptidase [Jeotgalibacillus sp. S-D1]TDL31013.1 Xaa-Pro dipeptidyl-peptidase [Jeotgalibacillus sp. S-D1]